MAGEFDPGMRVRSRSALFACLLALAAFEVQGGNLGSPRISRDGRVATISIDPDNVAPVKELIQGPLLSSRGLNVSLFTPVGMLPEVVISGEADAVKAAVDMISEMFLEAGMKRVIVISAILRELSDGDIRNLGLNLLPSSINFDARATLQSGLSPSGTIDLSALGTLLQLDESTGTGKILVSSQVFTPNGMKAQISDVQHVPVFSADQYGHVQTNFQDLETSIEVTPTIIHYQENAPVAPQVRLEIGVKASIITGEARTGSYTAPVYSDKRFQTNRIFPADGRTYVVGNFVSDSLIKSRSGVPLLSDIPLLKYLFSQETVKKQRNYAVLSIAVRVLPSRELGEPDDGSPQVSARPAAETGLGSGAESRGKEAPPASADKEKTPQAPPLEKSLPNRP